MHVRVGHSSSRCCFGPWNSRVLSFSISSINTFKFSSMTDSSTVINLRGSTDIVKEFFEYSVNTILYQRGVYPPESFKRVSKYGLAMMVTTDDALIEYISNIMNQLQGI